MVESKTVVVGLDILAHKLINNVGDIIRLELERVGVLVPAFTGKQVSGNTISVTTTFNGELTSDVQAEAAQVLDRLGKAQELVRLLER